jgi:hypothetical protein
MNSKDELKSMFTEHWKYLAVNAACKLHIFDKIYEGQDKFQEYKPNKNPSGDSMAQLLEAFLIAQQKNKNNKPLYGIEVVGATWKFITMEGKEYCISQQYDSLNKEDLLKIIAILRKFKHILFTRLMLD